MHTLAERAQPRVILALALIHFTGDFFHSFINPLMPLFMEKLSLSLAQVGWIVGINRLFAFVVQPPVGYLADRLATRLFMLLGPLLPVIFIALTGVAPNYFLLLACVGLGAVGSSMYHPTAAGQVPCYGGRHAGFSMSVFTVGGILGYSLGPLFISAVVSRYGLEVTPVTALLGMALMLLPLKIVPRPRVEGLRRFGFAAAVRQALGSAWKVVLCLWLLMVLRALVEECFLAFVPVLFRQQGYSLVSIGAVLSIFIAAGAASSLLAGHLADRYGYRPVMAIAFGLSTPALLALLAARGGAVYLAAVGAGFCLLASIPLGLAMAQELAPQGRSMAASLMMGLAMGLGGMLTPLVGKMADWWSLEVVLQAAAFIPVAGLGLIAKLPAAATAARPIAEVGRPSQE